MLTAMSTTTPFTVRGAVQSIGYEQEWDWQRVLAFCQAIARRQTDRRELAEDAAQEAALRAWRYRASCEARSDPRPWLAAITRREVVRQATGGGARLEVPVETVPEVLGECHGLAGADERATVESALATLVASDRRVLFLRYASDMTQPQIARVLDIPEGTVKIRLHRARARLRDQLTLGSGGIVASSA
jgi:RNA polymerase sigma-70 factor (ECF subfamily)